MINVPALENALAVWDRPGRGAVAAGIIQNGEIVFRREVGFANIEHSVLAHAGTRFQIASLSKQFLAALAVLLADEGRVSLDEDVRHKAAVLGSYPSPISLRQLLSHTSGFADTFDILTLAGAKVETPVAMETITALFSCRHHLNFETGEGFAYSNGGFEAAAAVIEAEMGSPLPALYDRYLFSPLGMNRTSLVHHDTTVTEGEANGYLVHNGEVRHATHGLPFNGGAGVLSTLDDLLAWELHLLSDARPGSLLSRLQTPLTFPNGARSLYGLGTYVDQWRGFSISGHGGLLPGFVAQVVRCLSETTSIVVLSNSSDVDSNGLARGMLEIALSGRGDVYDQSGMDIEPGRYFDAAKNELYDIRRDGEKMWAFTHGWRVPLQLEPDGSIIFDDPLLDGKLVGPPHLELLEWGKRWPLRRLTPFADHEIDLDRFVGSFKRPEIPTCLTFSRGTTGLDLLIEGAFGRASYQLERVDYDLFLGRSPAGIWMPFEMLIRFVDGPSGSTSSIKITTDRTKGIVFDRWKR